MLTVNQGTEETNKVLRNTFLLLAMTIIPTLGGVWAGMAFGLPAFFTESPWISLAIFMAMIFVLLFAINALSKTKAAIPLLFIFTAVMGASLSGMISAAFKTPHGDAIVALSGMGTVLMLCGCSLYASNTTRDFSSFKGIMFGTLMGLVVFGILGSLLHLTWMVLLMSAVSFVLFSLFLIYDVQQVIKGGQTDYVLATVQVHLDLVNIFSSLLQVGMSVSDD
jgi:FtsH-binding integral membrane protein